MKNKEQICVKLTQKNIKKVYVALKMFPMEKLSNFLQGAIHSMRFDGDYTFLYFNGTYWLCANVQPNRTEIIKPRELRNILFAEHCKEGDYVVVNNIASLDFAVKVTSLNKNGNLSYSDCLRIKDNKVLSRGVYMGFDFLRYATQEEIELLEGKKQTYRKQEVSIFKGSELVCVCVKDGYADKILSLLNGEK